MKKNKCELCNSSAKMYCESDQARLCWDCDAKIHGSNFLFAKHPRTLLCHICQSLTQWTASGPKLDPIVIICNECISDDVGRDDEKDEEDEDEEAGGDDNGGEQEDAEDGEENQVVP